MKKIVSMVLCLFAVSVFSGCSKHKNKDKNKKGEVQYITVKGSDTMVHLASDWAENFMKTNPKFEVSVTGGGSGTGIAALLNNMTSICAASRNIKEKEKAVAKQKGITPKETVVARDGIAVVVNPANPISELTLEQIKKIYIGAYENWKQVGGPDKNTVITSRDSSSGTYVFFQEHVLDKQDYSEKAMLMPATSSIIQTVSSNKWAIGYVGLGYALKAKGKVKMVKIKTDAGKPSVAPSKDTVRSGEYPISRGLFLYTNGKPAGTIKKFMDFCLSTDGQKIVEEAGYVSVK